ncbi:fibronectin type III domain-containing protein [Herbiconiux sp. 11R-BC]|uniref:fibronectin type III domain-containing protein n=1 Tax=Herbiconiux sp. 11R-BC TaxID=3111637 RepID=UPI003C0F4F44
MRAAAASLAVLLVAVFVFAAGTGGAVAQVSVGTGTLDQSNTVEILSSASAQVIAQTFTASISGPVGTIDLHLDGDYPAGVRSYSLSIQSVDSSGSPTGTILGTSVQQLDPNVRGWASFPVTGAVSLQAGTTYAIVVIAAGTFFGTNNSALPGASVLFSSGDGQYSNPFGGDLALLFREYVLQKPTISGVPGTDAPVEHPYSFDYVVDGGGSPATTSVDQSTLPPGLTLSSDGVLAGTPTTIGSYTFTVHATNSLGVSDLVSTVVTRARKAPDAPTGVTAVAGSSSADVSWAAPADPGDDPITGYTVTAWAGGAIVSTTSAATAPATITGLVPGTAYTFTVTATNASGDGGASVPSTPVIPYTTPGAPILTGTAGDGVANLSWTPSASDGFSAVSGYTLEQSVSGGAFTTVASPGPSTTTLQIAGLSNGTAYEFRVSAVNPAGTGAASLPAAVTPVTVPGAPTSVSVTPGDESALVTWGAPGDDGGTAVTGYTLEYRTGAGAWTTWPSAAVSPTAVTGLDNGTPYEFRVAAVNAAGTGGVSVPVTATPVTVPGAPTSVTVTPADGSAVVAWNVPGDDGGSAVTGYSLEYRTGAGAWTTWPSSAVTPVTVTGLTNGLSYEFRVSALNAVGTGPATVPATATPVTVPTVPTAVSVTPGDGSAVVTWGAPGDDGGSALTGYTLEYRAGAGAWTTWTSAAVAPTTVTGLANGTPYEFRVSATNGAGTGPAASPVAATPFLFTPTSGTPVGSSIDGQTVLPGDHVTLGATGLPAGSVVTIQLDGAVPPLTTVIIPASGVLDVTVVIPADATVGPHTLTLTVSGTGAGPVAVRYAFTVAAVAPPVTPTPTAPAVTPAATGSVPVPGRALAATGATVAPTLAISTAAALLLGAFLIVSTRLRRRRH